MTVAPLREMVGVVAAGVKAMCRVQNTLPADANQLQLAVEEVFLYALSTIKTSKHNADISARFQIHDDGFQVVIEYPGIRGPLDHYLQTDHLHLLQVKTFEALNGCIANKLLDSLAARYWPQEGINSYILASKRPESAGGYHPATPVG
ncbi:hypothetical protein [Desulfonatronum thioautotrophicum]|uniref:hypothetical protein n=1 Tax=Desulfonatronum thioautotrophicum TaxID=617001 RepID=UPI0005EB89B5|nr:hypothetical protein [Desulfonatronum thioautotrophicum]